MQPLCGDSPQGNRPKQGPYPDWRDGRVVRISGGGAVKYHKQRKGNHHRGKRYAAANPEIGSIEAAVK
jgi:hypothetical protein